MYLLEYLNLYVLIIGSEGSEVFAVLLTSGHATKKLSPQNCREGKKNGLGRQNREAFITMLTHSTVVTIERPT